MKRAVFIALLSLFFSTASIAQSRPQIIFVENQTTPATALAKSFSKVLASYSSQGEGFHLFIVESDTPKEEVPEPAKPSDGYLPFKVSQGSHAYAYSVRNLLEALISSTNKKLEHKDNVNLKLYDYFRHLKWLALNQAEFRKFLSEKPKYLSNIIHDTKLLLVPFLHLLNNAITQSKISQEDIKLIQNNFVSFFVKSYLPLLEKTTIDPEFKAPLSNSKEAMESSFSTLIDFLERMVAIDECSGSLN
jgi:hypothetical protein